MKKRIINVIIIIITLFACITGIKAATILATSVTYGDMTVQEALDELIEQSNTLIDELQVQVGSNTNNINTLTTVVNDISSDVYELKNSSSNSNLSVRYNEETDILEVLHSGVWITAMENIYAKTKNILFEANYNPYKFEAINNDGQNQGSVSVESLLLVNYYDNVKMSLPFRMNGFSTINLQTVEHGIVSFHLDNFTNITLLNRNDDLYLRVSLTSVEKLSVWISNIYDDYNSGIHLPVEKIGNVTITKIYLS